MANTNTITNLLITKNKVLVHATIVSDGTEETDLVIYDSSVIATALGEADSLTCCLSAITYSVASATSFILLEFDATTDVGAFSIPANSSGRLDFTNSSGDIKSLPGIKNIAGTGKTGDITITTTGLAAGDSVSLLLEVDPC